MRIQNRLICDHCATSIESSREATPPRCTSCGASLGEFSVRPDSPTDDFMPRLDETDPHGDTPLWVNSFSRVATGSIGRFELLRLIGDGGYGEVFLANDTKLKRQVALKVLKDRRFDEKSHERFLREAIAAARLSHPNIVSLHDYGRDDGRSWIAYQYIEGSNLAEKSGRQKIARRMACRIVYETATALEHAHRQRITHRDIKPSNIIIDGQFGAHLTDFGLARHLDLDSKLTVDGTIIGSLDYMAPEQALGRGHDADERSDIYSLGVVLYELLTGTLPFDRPTRLFSEKLKSSTTPVPSSRAVDPTIPKALDRICQRATRINPKDRYQDAGELAKDLKTWMDDEGERAPGHHRVVVAAALACFLLAGLALGLIFRGEWTGKGATPLAVAGPGAPLAEVSEPPTWEADPPPAAASLPFVLNTSRHVIHLSSCPHVKKIKDANRLEFKTFAEARDDNQALNQSCKQCQPDVMTAASE